MTVLEALTKARDLIADPARWSSGIAGQPKDGFGAHDGSTHCVVGALARITTGDAYKSVPEKFLAPVVAALPSGFTANCSSEETRLAEFNDSHSHAEVLGLIDRAIEAARA